MDKMDIILIIVGSAMALIGFTGMIVEYYNNRAWKALLIKRGYAQYNSITGDWEWK